MLNVTLSIMAQILGSQQLCKKTTGAPYASFLDFSKCVIKMDQLNCNILLHLSTMGLKGATTKSLTPSHH